MQHRNFVSRLYGHLLPSNDYFWDLQHKPETLKMEENRKQLRVTSQRLIFIIYVLVIGLAVGIFFLINQLEQDGIVNDTKTERFWGTAVIFVIWTFLCYHLYRITTGIFDRRSEIFDAREIEHYAAKETTRLREQFMANVSHEIRTPLNAIIGFSSLLLRSKLGEKEHELADNIQVASETLLSIINDILDLSKIEAGMLRLEKVLFDPNGLFHSMQQMFLEKARQKNLTLDLHIGPGVPQHLFGDSTRLTQVMVNLVGNALKFTDRGGVVVSCISLKAELPETINLCIEVRDSGIGIPADQLERIFERFTQSDEQTTRLYGGTGLGLSIVKQLVDAMKGSISVQSKSGEGSVFTVLIPFELKASQAAVSPVSKGYSDGIVNPDAVHILVVEDNPMNQRVVELLFEEWKVKYSMTHNGREAVDLLTERSTDFDLVLMDIQMPVLDGYEATHYIRKTLKLDIPIVAMTAHAFAGEREKCLQFGMSDYIAKPIREQELRHLIGRLVNHANATIAPEMDRGYLQETTLGNVGYQRELATIFIVQAPKDLDAIEHALSAENLSAAAKAAHNMKTTVGYMGFAQNIGVQLTGFEKACEAHQDLSILLRDLASIRKQAKIAIALVEKEFANA